MTTLNGRDTSKAIKDEIAQEVETLKNRGDKAPHLAAVIVGEDPASQSYVRSKEKACEKVGFDSTIIPLPSSITEKELLQQIKELNENSDIDGFIVQLPLPKHIDEQKIIMAIDPAKDVDGFHPTNFGKMALNLPAFLPATPFGIIELLERYEVPTKGKNTLVIGRSHIVGRPISILMGQNRAAGNSTVTLANSHTQNLDELSKKADIIIVAVGKADFLKANMVKDGAVIVDVGINRVPDESAKRGYVLKGDVDFDKVKEKASFITPVPGGVGPMTVTMLLKNTLLARKSHAQAKQQPS